MVKTASLIFVLLFLFQGALISKEFKGAELRTKASYIYGRFEASYKPPQGDGLLASFFTYHEIESVSEWNEIDFEILGRYDNDVQVTTITPGQSFYNSHQWVDFNTHEDFHTYAFEWTPEYVAWFVDGEEVYRQTEEHIATLTRDQKIMMNMWIPTWEPWVGHFNPAILPVFAYYDWVSYSSYTPGAGNTGTGNNFTLQWIDEFDSLNSERWEKATHTWGGNNVDFMRENVVFKDGHMILCLTDQYTLGYQDKIPPAVLWARAGGDKITVRFSEKVEQASAETKANYVISGVTVLSATLQPDLRTVELSVTGMDPNGSYNLAVLGIKDTGFPANKMTGQVVTVVMPQPFSFPVKINVGGSALNGWLPDQDWGPAVEYGHQDGYVGQWPATMEIQNTDEDSVYRTELREVVTYNIRVPEGVYNVKIMMAENFFKAPEKRLFEVVVEGIKAVERLDLYQTAGPHTAYEVDVENMAVNDGILNIHLENLRNYSLLNGIVVEQVSTGIGSRLPNLPGGFHLAQNYPNPFNASTFISFSIPVSSQIKLTVYDLLGKEVEVLANEFYTAGSHRVKWESPVSSGIYFYKLESVSPQVSFSQIRKMLVVR